MLKTNAREHAITFCIIVFAKKFVLSALNITATKEMEKHVRMLTGIELPQASVTLVNIPRRGNAIKMIEFSLKNYAFLYYIPRIAGRNPLLEIWKPFSHAIQRIKTIYYSLKKTFSLYHTEDGITPTKSHLQRFKIDLNVATIPHAQTPHVPLHVTQRGNWAIICLHIEFELWMPISFSKIGLNHGPCHTWEEGGHFNVCIWFENFCQSHVTYCTWGFLHSVIYFKTS